MQKQNIRRSSEFYALLFQIIAACSLGLFLGVMGGAVSGLLVLGLLAAIFLMYVILRKPEIALLGILIATSSIVFEDQLPMVSVGISLHIPDFLLLGTLGLLVIRWLVEPNFRFVRTPLDWPLLIFYGVTLFWTFNALIHSSVDIEPARRAIRFMTYYLTFFVVTNLVRDSRQLKFLINGFFLLAIVVASVMVAQYVLGSSVALLPGRVEELNTQGVEYSDVTRILPPGLSVVLVAFVATFCILILEKPKPLRWLKFLQLGLLGVAFLLTFLRSYFGTLLIAFSLLVFILRGVERQRLVKWIIVIAFLVTIIPLISNNQDSGAAELAGASRDRLSTIFNIKTFQGQDGSLNYRLIENEYALRQISSHPFSGLGLGAFYRPYDSRLDNPARTVREFIHNGHLRILLDSGVLGYLAFGWLSLTFLIRGFRYWRAVTDDKMRGVVLGLTLVYLAILMAALVNAPFVAWSWTPVFGIIMGVNEVSLRIFRQHSE